MIDPVKKMLGKKDNLTTCSDCDGSGLDFYNRTCKKCDGTGSYYDARYN